MASEDYSIVKFLNEERQSRCGYCRSVDTYYSHGIWAHQLNPSDYEKLLERGWRRCGHYLYKPIMASTCCPLYPIRCEVMNFRLSKSQKKVLRKVNSFLINGKANGPGAISSGISYKGGGDSARDIFLIPKTLPSPLGVSQSLIQSDSNSKYDSFHIPAGTRMEITNSPGKKGAIPSSATTLLASPTLWSGSESSSVAGDMPSTSMAGSSNLSGTHQPSSQGDGDCEAVDPHQEMFINRSPKRTTPCEYDKFGSTSGKKAKDIRRERKFHKLLSKGLTEEEAREKAYHSKTIPICKKLEDFLIILNKDSAHNLKVKLVQTSPISSEYRATSRETFALYKKYQIAVHGDQPKDCSPSQYERFLVHSPLEFQATRTPEGIDVFWGSFHQQYWLDDRLIAVGVIDILPNYISSVYFFYDPELKFLNLGTYGALREISFTRQLANDIGRSVHYCMGFYVHSCPKMRYKNLYWPSYLLCPETYIWQPMESCIAKLDTNKYSRLEEDPLVVDKDSVIDVNKILVCFQNQAMPYSVYKMVTNDEDDEEMIVYSKLVGAHCASTMLVLRP